MALKKLMGQNFRAFVGGTAGSQTNANAVVEETSCSVQITGNLEDSSSKDTEGSYTEQQTMSRQWQVQVDSYPDSSNGNTSLVGQLRALINMFNSDNAVAVGFDQTTTTAGGQNRTPDNADFARSGQAHLTDLSIAAPNRGNITISQTFQGTGALS